MVYENFSIANTVMLWSTFGIAFIMGAVVNKTNWCTMGAVSDLVNIGDTGRWRSWLFAMVVAIVGVLILEKMGIINLHSTRPPYRSPNFEWIRYILGGLLFGIGMTMGSGCGNKTLIRIGGGNIKSIFVLAVMGTFAYYMIFPLGDRSIDEAVFYPWTSAVAVSLPAHQDIGSLVNLAAKDTSKVDLRLWIGGGLSLLMLIYIFKSKDFFGKFDNILGGLVVGLAVVAMWFMTGSAKVKAYNSFDEKTVVVSMADYIKKWDDFQVGKDERTDKTDPPAVKPYQSNRVVGPQAMTFVSPSAWMYNFVSTPFDKNAKFNANLNVPVMLLLGVIFGSLFWSLVSRTFRIEWFASWGDFFTHLLGGTLMGIGGVMALGCTIGQGVTGVSTLSVGSFIAMISIVIGSALTMKFKLYRMVYEDAGFFSVLSTSLADLRLLPKGFKKLEAI